MNFEIKVLTQEQIEEYKGKEQMKADDLFK